SVARTSTVCWPSVSPVKVCGLVHAFQGPRSIRHSNVELGSLEANVKVAGALLGSAGTLVMAVSGGVESTLTLTSVDAGWPALSVATASSPWVPSLRTFHLTPYGQAVSAARAS